VKASRGRVAEIFGKNNGFLLGRLAKRKEADIWRRVRKIIVFSDFSRRLLMETYPAPR